MEVVQLLNIHTQENIQCSLRAPEATLLRIQGHADSMAFGLSRSEAGSQADEALSLASGMFSKKIASGLDLMAGGCYSKFLQGAFFTRLLEALRGTCGSPPLADQHQSGDFTLQRHRHPACSALPTFPTCTTELTYSWGCARMLLGVVLFLTKSTS